MHVTKINSLQKGRNIPHFWYVIVLLLCNTHKMNGKKCTELYGHYSILNGWETTMEPFNFFFSINIMGCMT